MGKTNFTVARVVTHTRAGVGKCERHNERKNENYGNMNVDLERTPMNIHFKDCGGATEATTSPSGSTGRRTASPVSCTENRTSSPPSCTPTRSTWP